ncbi:hypothetical protein COO60DRAFT_1652897 [Scenedesmus sp. NREL 46B-D3]|nr:hypothetical protein COO60DRAFT_1652897 [Scenedesmus sp. NREL 46B-D3]
MVTRWWQHDDRAGSEGPRAAPNSGLSVGYGRVQDAGQQQYSTQQQAALRVDAEPFKPQGPAPGFNRTATTANKAALPKVWEYEDPLKDVHGPFDAAQIINWFAQDWFGSDLKIRRIGQYWTMLEYVLEVSNSSSRHGFEH